MLLTYLLTYIDAACCYRWSGRGLLVCPLQLWDVLWDAELGLSKEPCIRWACPLAPPGECDWTIHVRQWYSLLVLLRYPKPTSKPRFFAKTVRRRNLGFSAITDGFGAHLHAKIIYKNLVNFTQQMFPSTLANNFLSAIGIAPILWSTDV